MTEKRGNPIYTGVTKHADNESGYAIWLPSDWTKFEMKKDHRGWIFSPYKEHFNTSFTVEKIKLKYEAEPKDLPILQKGFEEGIKALPGVEIESIKGEALKYFVILEARFTFLEGETRRKRWVKTLYWGNGQLLLIAQGETPEDFDYWLPMFFNTMMTLEFA